MRGKPTAEAASLASLSACKSFSPAMGRERRTLTPRMTSRFCLDGANGELWIRIAEIQQFTVRVVLRECGLAHDGDIQQSEDSRVNNVDHITPEAGKRVGTGRTGVDYGGHSLGNAVRVGRNSQRCHAIVHVNVDINESRRNNLASRVEHLSGLRFGKVLRQRHYFAIANRDVAECGKSAATGRQPCLPLPTNQIHLAAAWPSPASSASLGQRRRLMNFRQPPDVRTVFECGREISRFPCTWLSSETGNIQF